MSSALLLVALQLHNWSDDPPAWPSGSWARFCWHYRDCGGQPEGARILVARHGEPWQVWDEVRYPRRCWVGDMTLLPWGMVYLVVVAFNAAGESVTGHGQHAGDGLEDVSCP